MTNYYRVLGVKDFASVDEIKTAYRKLSKKLHPDVNGNDPFFTEKFKELQAAFETLTTNYKRVRYDMELRDYLNGGTNAFGTGSNHYNTSGNHNDDEDDDEDDEPEPEPQPQPQPRKENTAKKKKKYAGVFLFGVFATIGLAILAISLLSAKEDKKDTYSAPSTTTPSTTTTEPVVEEPQTQEDPPTETATTNDNANAESVIAEGNFTTGSTKEEVLQIQGKPKKIWKISDREEWTYEGGTVTFENEIVQAYDNSEGGLNVQLIAEGDRVTDPNRYFTVGSYKRGVLKIQGTPRKIWKISNREEWTYEGGTVTFEDDQVSSFDNSDKGLRVKLISAVDAAEPSEKAFTIGSTKTEVLRVQGTPSKIWKVGDREEWTYSGGTVTFEGGQVTSYDNSGDGLRIKL